MLKGLMPLSVVRPTNPGGAQRLVPGAVVALKAVVNGEFVCGFSAPLIANCTTQQESFQVVDAGNGNIALRSLDNNDYVTAENAGASSLIADQPALGAWQTFTEVDAENGHIGLLATANGKYVSAANAGASPLIASSTSVGSSESFTVVPGTSSCSTVPSAPTGLTATAASSSQINLNWTASTAGSGCSITYCVFGSTTSGFTPSSSNQIACGLTSTSFPNTGLAASTTYFYAVEAVDSAGSSGPSNQASAMTQPGSGGSCTTLCIDSGSTTAVSPFVADEDFTGGVTIHHANTINTSKVMNPAPAAVYQTARIATATARSYTYTIPGLTAGSSHTVRLHFCETFFTTRGSRVFNVSINGTQVLTNFDIVAASGGQNIANIQQFTATADASGHITITFTSTTNNALISGIEID
jgi:beta-galactosidase